MGRVASSCAGLHGGSAPVECLHAGRLAVARGWSARAHSHPFVELIVIFAGRLRVTISGEEMAASQGDVLCYRPFAPHRELAECAADFAFLAVSCQETGCGDLPLVVRDSSGRARVLARWLCDEQSSPSAGRKQCMDSFLLAILAEVRDLACTRPSDPAVRARAYLKDRLAEPHSLSELARRAAMSRFQFLRCYKRAVGRTPMEDLRQLRLDLASDLLLTTDLPLREIARRAGFCDEYYFSRVFRRYMRMPPGAFRRAH